MTIKKLELSNFRNYSSLQIELGSSINILYGDNAQGKTNILEAVYLGCTTKSQRAVREKEMIAFGSEEAHLRLFADKNGMERRVDMHLRRSGGKGVAIDGVPVEKAAQLYGMFNIVSFAPDDLSIVKNGPAERRRFIDMELCQLDRTYLHDLSGYNRALAQRNALLKQIGNNKELEDTLKIWDEQLVSYGTGVITSRRKFINELSIIAGDILKKITDAGEILSIRYVPNCSEQNIGIELAMGRDRDLILKTTGSGPHRDDLEFLINNENARTYGSQGQQRSVALALKLAEIELVRKKTGDNPVLLLDDVLSELDRKRQTQLLNSMKDIQTIVTCTGLEEFVRSRMDISDSDKYRIYCVHQGTIESKIS